MAYRLEKEQNGDTAIVIDGWTNGTSPDPYSGIGVMCNSNLAVPSEVSVGYPLSFNSTSACIAKGSCIAPIP